VAAISAPDPSAGARPIFLHGGFRTGTTWLWSRFRTLPGTCAFYEPFNELLQSLTPEMLSLLTPAGWHSAHPALDAPYYDEYRPLLLPAGGVVGFRLEFSYTLYYHAAPYPPQHAYLAGLIQHARGRGLVPVLGCCRTSGRLPWLRQYLPGYHVHGLRDPHDQWLSFITQAERHDNSYFLTMTYLIAAAGAYCSEYAWFFQGLPLPPRPVAGGQSLVQSLGETLQRLDDVQRCRIFLRVWMLDALIALHQADIVVDLNRLSADARYRDDITTTLRHETGLADLSLDDCSMPQAERKSAMWCGLVDEAVAFLEGVLPRFRDPPPPQAIAHMRDLLRQGAAATAAV